MKAGLAEVVVCTEVVEQAFLPEEHAVCIECRGLEEENSVVTRVSEPEVVCRVDEHFVYVAQGVGTGGSSTLIARVLRKRRVGAPLGEGLPEYAAGSVYGWRTLFVEDHTAEIINQYAIGSAVLGIASGDEGKQCGLTIGWVCFCECDGREVEGVSARGIAKLDDRAFDQCTGSRCIYGAKNRDAIVSGVTHGNLGGGLVRPNTVWTVE